ncbi:sialic acid-binding Ig-like lectin 12 isoform X3 [Ctenopharyngodon idella]|uniref:sialic acid-binding Ig-like lectin 12 isoform X3 n=1 Tax=Ctenopharyngodon idella TaxID=7959 RepID=UPI0022315297|nr:sialic acid-binding Ig-like lectin 12 isoform X3 [Ctenopharyngodon idella]
MLQTLLFILTVVQMTDCYGFDHGEPINFSILVTENFIEEAGLCIRVFCTFTVPQSVSEPIRRTWFKGDPQKPSVEVSCVHIFGDKGNERECSFVLENLVQGESDGEYSFKLEWGQGKVYIFPETVKITVKELTQKPTIEVPQLTAGEKAEISCKAPGDCVNLKADIVFKGIEPDEVPRMVQSKTLSVFTFHPEPEHHNTNLTCRVIFQENIWTESTVILKVRHAPKILNSSRCLVWGDELTCMCVSSGLPLPQIYWLILDGEYYSAFSAENTISIITVSIASFRNINAAIKCVSKNLVGWAEMEIQVHNHAGKPKVSWSLSTPWIFFTLSSVVNVIFACCLTVVLRRREKLKKPKDDNHVYMTSMAREESAYETIKMSSERY